MKKFLAIFLTACLAVGLVSAFSFAASASKIVSVTDICEYTITTVNVGLPHYRDGEDEQKLFDGIIPTVQELDDAVQEAIDAGADESLRGWFQWKGWIGIHSTGADAYKTNSAVDVNFAFEEAVDLKKLVVHCAAMVKGNVWIPSDYEIYLSEDGVTWATEPVITVPTEYQDGEALKDINAFDDTIILFDEAVTTQYFKLVANGIGCWWFCSEVEIFAEDNTIIDIDESSEAAVSNPAESSSEPAPPDSQTVVVSQGKTYILTGAEARGDGWDDDGVKLTDGIKVRDTGGGTNIVGLISHNMTVVIDLEEKTAISGINADAFGNADWGIASPTLYSLEFLYSLDDETYTSLGSVSGEGLTPVFGAEGDWVVYEFEKLAEVEARYIKVVYTTPENVSAHLWLSEISVFAAEEETSEPETPDTGDAGVLAFVIISVISLAGAFIVKRR